MWHNFYAILEVDYRMNRLEKMFRAAGLGPNEGVLIHKPSNIFYLSGYTGEGLLAVGQGFQAIVTDFRYT